MDAGKASVVPSRATYEDFDVLTGKADASKDEYFKSTFHTSAMNGDDPVFKAKASLMEESASVLLSESEAEEKESPSDKSAKARTKSQALEAAL